MSISYNSTPGQYNAQGVYQGPLGGPTSTIADYRNQQQQVQQTRDAFHQANPNATTMTTGQLYGVGAPNNYGGPYVAPKQPSPWTYGGANTGWGNDQGAPGTADAAWANWAQQMQQNYGTGAGTIANGATGNNSGAYGNGYTGYGGSNLTASGNPNYNGGAASGGSGGSSGPTGNGTGTNVPYYYSGSTPNMPWVNQTQGSVNPYPNASAPAPVMPHLNSTMTAPTVQGYTAPVYRSTPIIAPAPR